MTLPNPDDAARLAESAEPADLATMLRTLAGAIAVAPPDTLGVAVDPVSLVDGCPRQRATIHAADDAAAQRWVDALTAAGVSGWRPESDPPARIHVAEWRGWVLQVVWLPAAAVRALAVGREEVAA